MVAGPAWAQAQRNKPASPPAVAGATGDENKAGKAGRKALVLDRVAAVVNGSVILESELETRMVPLLAGLESIDDPRERERRQAKLRTQLLDDMISEELVVQAAREAKLEVEPKEVTAALEEIKNQNGLDNAQLEAALAQQGFTVQTYRKEVERQLLHLRAVNMLVRPRVNVTEEDVRARYDAMSRRSASVNKVHLKHVLVAVPDNPTAAQVEAAKARAAEIIEKVKAGASFDDVARQYSDDGATRDSGGDLGWIERGSIATEWEVIVFSMEQGEVRGPISGPRGLHVFFVQELAKTDLAPFDEVKEQLRNDLYRQEMDKQTAAWITELREKAFVDRKI
jgi:peptidyl-prolyl cis-trans isomerase SurA